MPKRSVIKKNMLALTICTKCGVRYLESSNDFKTPLDLSARLAHPCTSCGGRGDLCTLGRWVLLERFSALSAQHADANSIRFPVTQPLSCAGCVGTRPLIWRNTSRISSAGVNPGVGGNSTCITPGIYQQLAGIQTYPHRLIPNQKP